MITRRIARPLSAFSPQSWTCSACTRTSLRQNPRQHLQRRRAHDETGHKVPELYHNTTFTYSGVPSLFSSTGYTLGWTKYQGMIVQKLNELLAGESIQSDSIKTLITNYARDPMNASLFNHASMAHNNHFFFEALSTAPARLNDYQNLKESLEHTFGSIETLRITMLDTAAAMFGPGFVWLVWAHDSATGTTRQGDWRILTTYLAGTPYPEAGYRQQGIDMNNNNALSWSEYERNQPTNTVGKIGPYSKHGQEQVKLPPGGAPIMPVLCVNTWEHVYMYDYGLAGKRKYLSDWWYAVDWYTVSSRAPPESMKKDGYI